MKYSVFLLLLGCCLFGCSRQSVYLFSYFRDNGQDGLHLAYSEDAYHWTALKDDQSFLKPEVGISKLMRDPCIIRGGDGRFHMVWTAGWTEKGIGYAHSEDLIHWSEQQYIPVMEHEAEARNCWAPELFYDEASDTYMIYWATTIPGRFPETDSSGDNGYNHRMYYVSTRDFESFSDTRLLYDQGFNVIDATIHKVDGHYLMILKNEIKQPEPEKNIRIAWSDELVSRYSPASAPITPEGVWVEGPTAIETKDGWIVYFDQYINHRMGAIRSTDLENWTNISDQVHFPEGTRHGTVFRISKREFQNLISATE